MFKSRFRTRSGRIILATIGVALLVAACGDEDPTPTESDDAQDTGQDEVGDDAEALEDDLFIASWGGVFTDTTRDAFGDPFASETGVNVQFIDAPGEHAAQLESQTAADNVQWDVIDSLDENTALELWDRDLILPLPADLRERLEAVSIDGGVTEWGILQSSISDIIGCNAEAVERCPTTPEEFWDVDAFPGPRSMQDDPLNALAFALAADGVPYDEIFPMDIDRAFDKLEEILPHVRVFWSSGDQSQQVFRDEEVVIGTIWNGRAKTLIDEGFPLEVSWDGATYGPAYTVIVNNSPNPEAAKAYLEFYANSAEGQAEWANVLSYGVSNPTALDAMDPETAELLPESHLDTSIRVDAEWMRENRSEVTDRWRSAIIGS